jgi:hypothetical protein
MGARVAPILGDLAGRLSGRPPATARSEPMAWAYALRDAAALARPDVLVSHWDPALEADALAEAVGEGEGDWVDRLLAAPDLACTPPASAAVELVATLAGLFRSGPEVAATVTGPASVAAVLAPVLLDGDAAAGDPAELADMCADKLAGLIEAFVGAGATLVFVVEHEIDFLEPQDAVLAHAPLVRSLAHQRVDGVLVGAEGAGYPSTAARWDGAGPAPEVALLDPDLWSLDPPRFAERWPVLAARAGALLLSDGPLPAAMPLENLQAAHAAHAWAERFQ